MKIAVPCCIASLAFLLAACSLAMPAAVSQRVEGSFDRTLQVSGAVDLDVSTGSGRIDIHPGLSDRVEIHGRIQAGSGLFRSGRETEEAVRRLEANPPIEQSGGRIRIGRVLNRDDQRNISISYEIAVPAHANVTAHSGSGSQNVEGIEGNVEVRAGSGRIRLQDIRGDLNVTAGSGSIRAEGIRGGLDAGTGSGRIQVQGEQTARWELRAGSGSIDIDLPPDAAFDLRAHTGSGGVEVNYPMSVQGRIGDRHNVSGRVGGGGPTLDAHTGSGHIRIH